MATQEATRLALRKLWSDHVVWTRLYILEAVDRTPVSERLASVARDLVGQIGTSIGAAVTLASAGDAAAIRLLRNQEDIANAFVPYYGPEAAGKLTNLLRKHIMIAVELVAAAKTRDDAKFKDNDKQWDDNAREIAAFLAGANPHWPEADVYDLLEQHLRLTKGEVTARLKRDWAADVKAFDDIFTEAMVIADTLADGLALQFPERFEAERATEARA